jgi:hypothetical protein
MAKSSARVWVYPYGLAHGRLSPMVPVGLCIKTRWQVVQFYVDSGAFYTLRQLRVERSVASGFESGRQEGGGLVKGLFFRNALLPTGRRWLPDRSRRPEPTQQAWRRYWLHSGGGLTTGPQ